MSDRVLLRAHSGPRVGMGHVMRTRAVALEVEALGGQPLVVVDDERSAEVLRASGLEAATVEDRATWYEEEATGAWIDGFLPWRSEADGLGHHATPLFLVENRGPARELSHRIVYPALHYEPDPWDRAHEDRVLGGPAWIPLAPEVRDQHVSEERDVDLCITFGGADPLELTERVLGVLCGELHLDPAGPWPRRIVVAVGPHMAERRAALERRFGSQPGLELLPTGAPLAPWFARSRAALTALGTTLYELAYLGVPALVLANYAGDRPALDWYDAHGPHRPLGIAEELSQEGLRAALIAGLAEVLQRPPLRIPELGPGAQALARELLGRVA